MRNYYTSARHRGMRLEDRWHQLRLNMAKRRGQYVTVLSMAGYGYHGGSGSSRGW